MFEPIYKPLKKHVDASKVTDHYALLPTRKLANLSELSVQESNIYLEVVKSATALFMAAYQYEETKIVTTINDVPFHTTGRIKKIRGWKEILQDVDSKDMIYQKLRGLEQQPLVVELLKNYSTTDTWI